MRDLEIEFGLMSELFWFYDLVYSLILASTAFANTFGVAALHEFVRF